MGTNSPPKIPMSTPTDGDIVAFAYAILREGIVPGGQKKCKLNDANPKMGFGTGGDMTVTFN